MVLHKCTCSHFCSYANVCGTYRFKTIIIKNNSLIINIKKKKKKTSNRVFPILLFSISPCPPSLFQKPRHSVKPQVTFSTEMSQYWKGIWPLNKNSQNNALKTCKAISRHFQRIVQLRSDEHFAFKEKPWCPRKLIIVRRFSR